MGLLFFENRCKNRLFVATVFKLHLNRLATSFKSAEILLKWN
jgi:hypothetical protein